MKKKLITVLLLCSIVAALPGNAQHTARKSFNKDWKFLLDSTQAFSDPDLNDADWRTLNLPHDWSIEGTFSKDHPAGTGGGALPGGIGWYRKTFTLPAADKGKEVFIEFDGVYRNSEVFINGHSMGKRPYGYSSFQYNLTPHLKWGRENNVLAVKVDNSKQPNSRWYSGSGIYRNVWLTTVSKTHISHWGTFVTTPVVNGKEAVISIRTEIQNPKDVPLVLRTVIYDKEGNEVGRITGKVQNDLSLQKILVKNPSLWSTEKPVLYKAVSSLLSG